MIGFEQFLCNEDDTNEGLTVEGENSGLRTVILTSSLEPFSFKFVMVEAFKDSSNSKNQIQEVRFRNLISTYHFEIIRISFVF